MMKTATKRSWQALLVTMLVAGCAAAGALGPLVILTNQWRDAADANHTFQFNDDTGFEPKRSGTFTGEEQLPSGTKFPLQGSWNDKGKIQFTVQRSSAVTYSGTLSADHPDRIDFTSSAGNLTLVRN